MARPIQHTRYLIDATYTDEATPVLALLREHLTDRKPLHAAIAEDAKVRTRRWIRAAAEQRHTTAEALGAQPTGYLGKRAREVESSHDNNGGRITVKGAIFARVFRPVVVTPKRAKLLTIPVAREAYGKRARDFDNLVFKKSKKTGNTFLARKHGRGLRALFVLLKSVTLPQDAGLLPNDAQFGQWAEAVAREHIKQLLA